MFNKNLIFRVKIKNINVGFSYAENERKTINCYVISAKEKFEINRLDIGFGYLELFCLNYGGFMEWRPKSDGIRYQFGIYENELWFNLYSNDGVNLSSQKIATTTYVDNLIGDAISNSY